MLLTAEPPDVSGVPLAPAGLEQAGDPVTFLYAVPVDLSRIEAANVHGSSYVLGGPTPPRWLV